MLDDVELLRLYAEEGSEAAFTELVGRRIDLVYAVALRRTGGDAHRAQDAAQRVFTDLARKAAALAQRPTLTGWLYRSAQFAAADLMRSEQRRQAREMEAQRMDEIQNQAGGEPDWRELRPVLDETLAELNERDRDAVLMRFFEQRRFAEIAARLRLTEDAARVRVDRALEKMRAHLALRGLTSTAAALGGAMATQAAGAAPAGVATAVASGALSAAATASGSAAVLAGIFTMSKIKTAIAGAVIIAALTTTVIEVRGNRALRSELGALRAADDELGRLQRERARLDADFGKIGGTAPEVAELTRLRQRIAQLAARPEGVVDAEMKPIGPLGRATAEAAFVSFIDALNRADLDAVAALIAFPDDPKEREAAFVANFSATVRARYRTPEHLYAAVFFGAGKTHADPGVAFQTLSLQEEYGSQLRVRMWVRGASGRESEIRDVFIKTPAGWAMTVPRPLSDRRIWSEIQTRIDPATGDVLPAKK